MVSIINDVKIRISDLSRLKFKSVVHGNNSDRSIPRYYDTYNLSLQQNNGASFKVTNLRARSGEISKVPFVFYFTFLQASFSPSEQQLLLLLRDAHSDVQSMPWSLDSVPSIHSTTREKLAPNLPQPSTMEQRRGQQKYTYFQPRIACPPMRHSRPW